MKIRRYRPEDLTEILRLFYDTVHTVCTGEYTPAQLDAWADGHADEAHWDSSLRQHFSLVYLVDDRITGFGDIAPDGYLDRLYVHQDYQRRGIAAALCDALEGAVNSQKLTTHASLTAKPFFEKRGYIAVKEQQVERNGIWLTNFVMEKIR